MDIIEYEELRKQALFFRPAMILCGASAYPRTIDFARFRAIADEVDAILMWTSLTSRGSLPRSNIPLPSSIATWSAIKPSPTLRSRSPCASWAPPLHRGLVRGSFPAPHHHDPNETLLNFCILGYGCCTWLKSVCMVLVFPLERLAEVLLDLTSH